MAQQARCIMTVLIPHGNTIADLEAAAQAEGTYFHGIPQCIPLCAEANSAFRELWEIHRSKHSQLIGFRAALSFADDLAPALSRLAPSDSESLSALRAIIPQDHRITFSGPLSAVDLLPSPTGYSMLMGIKKEALPSAMEENASCIVCKSYRLVQLELTITDTGLLTWRECQSLWAPKSR